MPGAETKFKQAWGIAAGVVAACVPAVTWLALTYSYRADKQMVITQVVKNVKSADIGSNSPAQVDTTALRQSLVPRASVENNLFMRGMLAQAGHGSALLRVLSAPSSTRQNLQSASSTQSRQTSSTDRQSSMHSVTSDLVQNPLLSRGTRHTASASEPDLSRDFMLGSTKEMQSVARQITVRCLRRWDGFLGIRAGSDGLGRRSGIWRDKFDGVHYSVLLLAMHKLNETLTASSAQPSELLPYMFTGLFNEILRDLRTVMVSAGFAFWGTQSCREACTES